MPNLSIKISTNFYLHILIIVNHFLSNSQGKHFQQVVKLKYFKKWLRYLTLYPGLSRDNINFTKLEARDKKKSFVRRVSLTHRGRNIQPEYICDKKL